MTRRAVVATAGHVDHGKTSLVRALTGAAGDRLPEEKKRGITIALGYAQWELPDLSVSIVDVPGHERFVGTMVAGAAGIDAVLLVVAADDGVMPQTREHLAICGHLGIARGVVAITKIDAADESTTLLVEEDVRETLRGTFLEGADIVRCSAKNGVALDEVARAVRRSLERERAPRDAGPPWLPIDRVFTKHGHGTVVTGTLARGTVRVGDELVVLGASDEAQGGVRGLHVHDTSVASAAAPTRLAINVRGIESARLARGLVLTSPGWQRAGRSIEVALRLREDDALDPRRDLVLHVGAAHVTVRARSLSAPDAHGIRLVRLDAEMPFATYATDRFVLRRPELDRDRTIGGGEVVDPHPALARPKKRSAPYVAPPLRDRVLALVAERAAGVSRRDLVARLSPDAALAPVLSWLVRERAILEVAAGDGPRWVAVRELDRAKTEVRSALVAFHRTHPAIGGASVAELAGGVPGPWRPLVPIATAALVREGAIAGGERVAAIGHDALALADGVLELYARAALEPIGEDAARAACGLPERTFRDVVAELVRRERLVRIATGTYVDAAALDALVARVRAFFDTSETLAPGDFKTLSGLTRKNAIAVLEWLDRRGVTRRKGDVRVRA